MGDPAGDFDSASAAKFADITLRQLNHWDRSGLVSPSKQAAAGSGSRRRYSTRDLLLLLITGTLREHHLQLADIRRIHTAVREKGIDEHCPPGSILVFSGGKVAHVGQMNRDVADHVGACPLSLVVNLGMLAKRARAAAEIPPAETIIEVRIGGEIYPVVTRRRAEGRFGARCNAFPNAAGEGDDATSAAESLVSSVERNQPPRQDGAKRGKSASGQRKDTPSASTWGDDW